MTSIAETDTQTKRGQAKRGPGQEGNKLAMEEDRTSREGGLSPGPGSVPSAGSAQLQGAVGGSNREAQVSGRKTNWTLQQRRLSPGSPRLFTRSCALREPPGETGALPPGGPEPSPGTAGFLARHMVTEYLCVQTHARARHSCAQAGQACPPSSGNCLLCFGNTKLSRNEPPSRLRSTFPGGLMTCSDPHHEFLAQATGLACWRRGHGDSTPLAQPPQQRPRHRQV